MKYSVFSLPIMVAVVLFLTGCSSDHKIKTYADSVYVNGRVHSVQEGAPLYSAFAIKDGKFIYVGKDSDVQAFIGETTRTIDLQGRFVMPGIQDSHIHTAFSALYSMNLQIDPSQSWEEIARAIRDYAAKHPPRRWIFGGAIPWLTDVIGEAQEGKAVAAHKSTLDAIVSDRPVVLMDVGAHAVLANSLALELAGITSATPDPQGGTIERDAQGNPTGVLRELAANLVTEIMDMADQSIYNHYMLQAMQRLQSLGVTSITEVWADGPAMQGLMALETSGKLTMRVTAAIGHPMDFATPPAKSVVADMIKHIDRYQGKRLQTRYVKYVLDGSAGGQTLVMNDPYEGSLFRGHYRNDRQQVISEVTRLHGLGVGSVIHAVGDGAIRTALDAVESAIQAHGDNGVRHSIAHTVFVNPEDLDRFAELGVNAEFSPYFWWPTEGLNIVRRDIGDRTEWGFPVNDVLQRGNHISAGSDWPVVFDPNPFPAIEALVTREVPGGSEEGFARHQAITLPQALKIFTLGGAYVNYAEDTTGTIEVGKFADFIVLDRDLLSVPVRDIHNTQVLQTVIEGQVVFSREEFVVH